MNYEAEYNNVLNGFLFESKYMGHYFIIMICSRIGFTFVQYLHVYYFVSLGFLYIALKKFTLNINVVLSFYMIYSFGIDAIQMKTMLADALILYAISFLIEAKIDRNEKRNSIKKIGLFCVFSISSIAIHFTSILFFLVGFIYYLVDDKKYRKYIYLFTSVVFVLSYMNILPKLVLYVGRFFPVFDIEYVTSWMEHEVQLGWIVLIPPIVLSSCKNSKKFTNRISK